LKHQTINKVSSVLLLRKNKIIREKIMMPVCEKPTPENVRELEQVNFSEVRAPGYNNAQVRTHEKREIEQVGKRSASHFVTQAIVNAKYYESLIPIEHVKRRIHHRTLWYV
jgi:hypothetical protein